MSQNLVGSLQRKIADFSDEKQQQIKQQANSQSRGVCLRSEKLMLLNDRKMQDLEIVETMSLRELKDVVEDYVIYARLYQKQMEFEDPTIEAAVLKRKHEGDVIDKIRASQVLDYLPQFKPNAQPLCTGIKLGPKVERDIKGLVVGDPKHRPKKQNQKISGQLFLNSSQF